MGNCPSPVSIIVVYICLCELVEEPSDYVYSCRRKNNLSISSRMRRPEIINEREQSQRNNKCDQVKPGPSVETESQHFDIYDREIESEGYS